MYISKNELTFELNHIGDSITEQALTNTTT